MSERRHRLMLSVVATDATFEKQSVRGVPCWVGRCLFCRSKVVVELDGSSSAGVTLEHIVPQTHGGSEEPENLGIACARCNQEKGRRHDARAARDPRRVEVTERLLAERRARLREPSAASDQRSAIRKPEG